MTAIVNSEYSIDRATGNIRVSTLVANHTVLEFYEWIRGLGDDLVAVGDDLFDITDDDIASKAFETIINLLGTTNIDYATSKTLFGGSIVQSNGVIYDGITVIAPAGTPVDIIQAGAMLTNFWGISYNADATKGISHKFLIQTANASGNIDNGRLLGQTRKWNKTYSEFLINGTARGENALPLSSAIDLNNASTLTAISNLTGFVLSEGFNQVNADGLGGTEDYYWKIDKGTNSINQAYEKVKHLTRSGSATTVFGLSGDLFRGITHSIVVSSVTGTFATATSVSWGTGITVGTGQLLAINTAKTKIWIQHITGDTPNGNITDGTAVGTVGTVASIPLSTVAIGASTGASIVGAYGVVLPATQLTSSDKVTDLTGATIQPPNVQTFTVGNLEQFDTVLLAPDSGGGIINKLQLTTNGIVAINATSITVTSAIPLDTPNSGTIRLHDGSSYIRIEYTSWSGSTFTVNSTTVTSSLVSGAKGFISYIDTNVSTSGSSQTAAYQAAYLSDRALVAIVRNAQAAIKIKTFKAPVSFTSSGGATNAIRTVD